jgi:hypothetical protein
MARRRTYTDGHGTLRFVGNPVVRDLVDEARAGRQFDMNAIWIRYCESKYTKQQMREFYQLMGYSVSGYEEIDFD